MPTISVLFPVRDAAPWLASAIASLRRQTDPDFEIVAVDDGSRDDSADRLDRIARDEARLRVIRTEARGLPAALQTAFGHARGSLLARQDADDLSHRRRFELQRAWLAAHPEDAVVGSRVRLFPGAAVADGMRRWIHWHNRLLTHERMEAELLIDSPLAHGCAMLRREALERVRGWRECGWPEDLDLWVRLMRSGERFAKRPETLYGWRQHAASATRRDPRYAPERFLALKVDALRRGWLAEAREVRLVGTGRSLDRWHEALEGADWSVHRVVQRVPAPLDRDPRPTLLVFGIAEVRERWRTKLASSDMRELRDFMFVA